MFIYSLSFLFHFISTVQAGTVPRPDEGGSSEPTQCIGVFGVVMMSLIKID